MIIPHRVSQGAGNSPLSLRSLPISYTLYCDQSVSSDSNEFLMCSFLCIPRVTRSALISDSGAVSESTNDAIDDVARSDTSACSVIGVPSLSVIAIVFAPLLWAYAMELIVLAEYLGKEIPIRTSSSVIGITCSKSSFVQLLLTRTTSSKSTVI